MSIISQFCRFAEQADPQIAFAYSHPVLLWSDRWPELEDWIATRSMDEQPLLINRLGTLQNWGSNLEQQPSVFPADQGPVELLVGRIEDHEIGLDHALKKAMALEVADALSPLYIWICSVRAYHFAMNGNWRHAVLIFRILLAALDAWNYSRSYNEKVYNVIILWLEVTSLACRDVPDGRLYREAFDRGRVAAESAEKSNDASDAWRLRRCLGILNIDPYVSGRINRDFEAQMQRWQTRLVEEYGAEVVHDKARLMPEPADALTEAVNQLELALALQPDDEGRGLTLKTLAEARYWREIAGGPAEPDRTLAAAKEAIALLNPQKHANLISDLNNLLRVISPSDEKEETQIEVATDSDLIWLEPEEWAERDIWPAVIDHYIQQAQLVMTTNPGLAIALLRRIAPLADAAGDELQEVNIANLLGSALIQRFDADALLEEAGGDMIQAGANLDEKSAAERWAPAQIAAGYLALASTATSHNLEDDAIPIVHKAIKLFQSAGSNLVKPSLIIAAMTMVGAAVNELEEGNIGKATDRYVGAISQCVDARLPHLAVHMIERAEDTALRGDYHIYRKFLIGLAEYGPLLSAGGSGIASRLQQSWQKLIDHIYSGPELLIEPIWLALEAAKGGAFAAMLHHGTDYNWRLDHEATRMLARLAELRSTLPDNRTTAPESTLDEELLLAAYAAADPQSSGGETPDEILINLEQGFDGHLAGGLIGKGSPVESLPDIEEIQKLLDPRTVLLTQHIGRTNDYAGMLVTSENVYAFKGISGLPSMTIVIGDGDNKSSMNLFGLSVADLRKHLLEEPGPAEVVPEAAEDLAKDCGMLIGGRLFEWLAELHATGKDHLCIHGHGPLHFYPQHLLGPEGHPLADDWIVTVIPHPAILRRSRDPLDVGDRLPIAAFGLGFDNGQPHNLPPLKAAAREAQSAASILGGRAWVDSEATESRFVEALTGATRVHLSTHGRHRVSAPAFQSVYLYPDHASDGIFFAYEALGLDLRNLDVITLSACETALGRMDIGDSPRGLAASMFIAGARTIIGCLWPVPDDVAGCFFGAFYNALASGAPKLEAFRAAQNGTRKVFPAYRDWGTFQYSGLW
jgi:hypothetical protein